MRSSNIFNNYQSNNRTNIILLTIFGCLFLSPLVNTHLPIKQYTRLNEIFLMLATIYYLTNGKLFKYGFNKIEISLLLLAISLSISILFGYIFLGVYPAIIDFYQVFNLFLFVLYFKIGRLSDIANFDKIVKVVSIIFLTYSIFNIININHLIINV